MKVSSKNAQGFTLIETCIALVVMMVVGLGATSLFLFALRNNTGGSERSQALAIAQQRLEELRSLRYDDPQLAIGQTVSTVVLQDVAGATAAAPSAAGGVQAYSSATSGGTVSPSSKPGKRPPATPTPTPTTGSGGGGSGGGGGGGGGGYKLVLDVEGLPAGSATPTQKRITVTVTPENGYGAAAWMNLNPVVIVIHRSSPATGPYRL
ncbi:MAG TPA: prepilin-type N-terminal cleavage/methylation domain-containing protein [Pyrinomonadaceae bacterium]